MGCVGSRDEDNRPNVFRVVTVPNHHHQHHNNNSSSSPQGPHQQQQAATSTPIPGDEEQATRGQLEVTSANLTLYRKRKPTIAWPLQCLRRYGYENETFIFEAGRRCKTGEGIYSFRCRRADVLFALLQEYIQESTYNNNNNLTVNLDDGQNSPHEGMDTDVAELRRALVNQQTTTTSGSNYIILHGSNEGTTTQQIRGVGGGGQMAIANSASPCSASPPNGLANNYLEPVLVTPTNSATPTTSNNNNNIYTNSMVMGSHATSNVNSTSTGNVYQQLALAQSSPAGRPQTTTEQPKTVENTPAGTPGSCSSRPLLATSESLMRLRASMSTDGEMGSSGPSQATSPTGEGEVSTPLIHNTYMNVTPGEMMLLASSTTTTGSNNSNRYSRMNSNASVTTITERCYENLDPATISAAINGSPTAQVAAVRVGRHSRPDIFSKVDLPLIEGGGGARMSEPCTPTSSVGGGLTMTQQRKVNYIVLDLDSTSGTSNSSSGMTASGGSGGGMGNGTTTTPGGGGGGGLLTPDSPKKRAEPLGYATIDFNKTVALSNSTNPTNDDSSRRTRF